MKSELEEKVSHYETLVYTDEQIKEAKSDRANLNKLKKALNDERIRREKEYLQPFNVFKAQINEIIGIIDRPITVIDSQVKAYEEKQKQEKRAAIEEVFGTIGFQNFVSLDKIFNDKWLNASTSLKSIEDEMRQLMYKFSTDLLTLNNLPEYGFEAVEVYKSTLDINKAITEAQRMAAIAKAKAEKEAEQARLKEEEVLNNVSDVPEQKQPEEKQWVRFQAYMTVEQAKALGQYMKNNGIEYKAV